MKYFKKAMLLVSAGLLMSVATATSDSQVLCEGFVPPNDMKIPVGDYSHIGIQNNGGLTEAEYNAIMDRIEAMYTSVFQGKGATLVVNRLWKDSTVNASAEQRGKQWIINMYGGIARHPDVTIEGQALIACHEIGHHIGGAPKIKSFFGGAWATNEGGADYFSTLKCLREFFAPDDNAEIIARTEIDPLAKDQCEKQFSVKADQEICMRISMAGESVSYVFQDLKKEQTRPRFSTPDTSKVNKTNDKHPATQCRMDTYFSGSLCPVAISVPNSDTDYKAGSCIETDSAVGFRPRCWFSPESGGGGGGGGEEGCPFGDQSTCDEICKIDPSQPFCKTIVY